MKKYKHVLMGGVFLLLSILMIGCKKDDPEPTPPPVPQPNLVLKEAEGGQISSGSVFSLTLGQTKTLTVEVAQPNTQLNVNTQGNAVTVQLSPDKKTLIITPKEAGTATVTLTYGTNNNKFSFRVTVAQQPQPPISKQNPAGLFKGNGQAKQMTFGFLARKSNELWIAENVATLKSKYIRVLSTTPIQNLQNSSKVKVTTTGFNPDLNVSNQEFTVSFEENGKLLVLTHNDYKIVVLK